MSSISVLNTYKWRAETEHINDRDIINSHINMTNKLFLDCYWYIRIVNVKMIVRLFISGERISIKSPVVSTICFLIVVFAHSDLRRIYIFIFQF